MAEREVVLESDAMTLSSLVPDVQIEPSRVFEERVKWKRLRICNIRQYKIRYKLWLRWSVLTIRLNSFNPSHGIDGI
uniref:Uncharacterized protein n=1 Tax=Oryza nivara TaxID=4536 RepID=A0A0E0H2H2_ORYNI